MRDVWADVWPIALFAGIVVLSAVGFGIYISKTTRCAAFEYRWVLVPVEGNAAVLTPMSTGMCAQRVPR